MSRAAWKDSVVVDAMRALVDNLGRRAAFDPGRLRAALNDELGSRAHEFRAAVDALVLAAMEGVPQDILDGTPRDRLVKQVTTTGLETDLASWVVEVWATTLRVDSAAGTSTALPVDDQVPPRAGADADPAPAGVATSSGASTPDRPIRRRLRFGVVAAAALALATVGAGVGVIVNNRSDGETQTTASYSGRPSEDGPTADSSASAPPASTDGADPAAPAPLVVLAHEGGSENFAPETTAALVDAVKNGAAAETDVRWTRDGVPVLAHDDEVSAPWVCTGGADKVVVANTDYSDLLANCTSAPDASRDGRSYPIPRFGDAVEAVAAVPGSRLFAEVKTELTPEQLSVFLDILQRNDMMDRTVVTSFLPQELAKVRAAAATDGTNIKLMEFRTDEKLSAAKAKRAGLWAVAVREGELTSPYAAAMDKVGIVVIYWTVNEPSQWTDAREAGADFVLTDRPIAFQKWAAKQ